MFFISLYSVIGWSAVLWTHKNNCYEISGESLEKETLGVQFNIQKSHLKMYSAFFSFPTLIMFTRFHIH